MKKRLKKIEQNQRILNVKIEMLLELCGATEAQLKTVNPTIKPPRPKKNNE